MKKGKQSQNRTGLLFKKFVSVRCSSGGLLRAAVVAILFLMSVCSLTADVRASVMIWKLKPYMCIYYVRTRFFFIWFWFQFSPYQGASVREGIWLYTCITLWWDVKTLASYFSWFILGSSCYIIRLFETRFFLPTWQWNSEDYYWAIRIFFPNGT